MDAFEVMVQDLRGYFMTNVTKPAEWRKSQLMALKQMLTKHEMEWAEAMAADLKRPLLEARAEVVIALKDLNDSMQFQQWMRPEKLPSPALVWPCNTEVSCHAFVMRCPALTRCASTSCGTSRSGWSSSSGPSTCPSRYWLARVRNAMSAPDLGCARPVDLQDLGVLHGRRQLLRREAFRTVPEK
eukprot:2712910-Rhodomonas_salina.2